VELEGLEKFFSAGFLLLSKLLGLIVKFVPIAVFGVIASMVGVSGFSLFSALSYFVLFVILGLFLHAGVYYSVLLWTIVRISPFRFFKDAGEALITAFGTGSSLATLPVTLRTLQEKMKVSAESSRLAACIGTNLNHDGILLYEAVAGLFVAHIYGIHLSLFQKVLLFGSSLVAAVGIAGVPDAGLITLSLVLSSAGLPLTLVPAFMTVDWLIGRLRATVNVTSDMVVAQVLDRLEGSSAKESASN
jgi:Na+/H+-dicarboxylate symporter